MLYNKRIIIFILAGLSSTILSANTLSERVFHFSYKYIIFIFAALVIIGAIATLFGLMMRLLQSQKQEMLGISELELEIQNTNTEPWYKKLYAQAWKLAPMEKEQDIMLHHDFDGIHELDNKLPPWWVYLFYITIVWAGVYFYMFQISDNAISQEQEYFAEMQTALEQKRAYAAKQANSVDEYNVVYLMDEESLAAGESLFQTNCAACHGTKGEGIVGPNLTDVYWLHGGDAKNIFKSIKYGIPDKGMIAWQSQMSPSSMQQLTSYIHSLKGTNPPNAKAKQGILFEENAENLEDKVEETDIKEN